MSFNEFELEALKAHNEYRAKHGSPPLTLSREICNYAQEWANYLAGINVLQHRTNGTYGENLYCMYGTPGYHKEPSAKDAVESWYNEVKYYNYARGGFSMQTGHFTAVVWKSTTQFGIAKASNGRGATYIVANYNPWGNMMGQFQQNVLPPQY